MEEIIDGKEFKRLKHNKKFIVLTDKTTLDNFIFDKTNNYYYTKSNNYNDGLKFTDLEDVSYWYHNSSTYQYYREVEILDNSKVFKFYNYYSIDKFLLKEENSFLDLPIRDNCEFCDFKSNNLYFKDNNGWFYFIPRFISLILETRYLHMLIVLNPSYSKFKELGMKALEKNPNLLKTLNRNFPNFIDNDMCLKVFDNNIEVFFSVEFSTVKLCEFFKTNWDYITKKCNTEFILLKLCKKIFNDNSFKNIKLIDMLIKLIKEDKFTFPKENQNQGICDYAYKIDYKNLRYFSDEFKTKEMCEDAFKKDIDMIKYVKDCYKTKEMCLEAIEKDIYLFKYTNYYDFDICKKVLQHNSNFLNCIDKEFLKKNQELYKYAYKDELEKISKYEAYRYDNKFLNIKDIYSWEPEIIILALTEISYNNIENFYSYKD